MHPLALGLHLDVADVLEDRLVTEERAHGDVLVLQVLQVLPLILEGGQELGDLWHGPHTAGQHLLQWHGEGVLDEGLQLLLRLRLELVHVVDLADLALVGEGCDVLAPLDVHFVLLALLLALLHVGVHRRPVLLLPGGLERLLHSVLLVLRLLDDLLNLGVRPLLPGLLPLLDLVLALLVQPLGLRLPLRADLGLLPQGVEPVLQFLLLELLRLGLQLLELLPLPLLVDLPLASELVLLRLDRRISLQPLELIRAEILHLWGEWLRRSAPPRVGPEASTA
mmetsp:Transcript_66264/g.132981  ORF Transcript_66264/g.132981 Transcript_66264/m.132981 type:complete len:280 (+) Transcript_66264:301-1140(+)